MKFYTGRGDDGTSNFLGTERVPKTHPRFEALGAVDELNSYLGICRSLSNYPEITDVLKKIQDNLFIIQAEIGAPGEAFGKLNIRPIDEEKLKELERIIDGFGSEVGEIREFTIPGGSALPAHLDYARTLARTAERKLAYLQNEIKKPPYAYLNRLSSLLFVFARWVNKKENRPEEHPTYI